MWVAVAPIKEGAEGAADRVLSLKGPVDRQEFAPAFAAQTIAIEREQRAQYLVKRIANRRDRLVRQAVGAAERFRHDSIDNAQPEQLRRGQSQRLGGLRRVLAIAPQDRGAALGRDHRING